MTCVPPSPPLEKFDASQPRDDKGRWRDTGVSAGLIAGGGVGGAVAGGLAARQAVEAKFGPARRAAYQRARAAVAEVDAAKAKNSERTARHAETVARVGRRLSSGKQFKDASVRSLRTVENRVARDLRQHMTRHAEPFWPDGADDPVWASTDARGEKTLRENRDALRAQIDDIRTHGKAPTQVTVAEHVARPKVEQFERKVRGPARVVWRDEALVAGMIRDEAEHFRGLGIRSVDDARREIERLPRSLIRRVAEDWGLPVPRVQRERRVETVRNVSRTVPEYQRNIDGYPAKDDRQAIRRWLMTGDATTKAKRGGGLDAKMARNARMAGLGAKPAPQTPTGPTALPRGLESYSIEGRARAWAEGEPKRAAWRVATARMKARSGGGWNAVEQLARLRTKARIGRAAGLVLGAGAGVGISAAADWARRRFEKIAPAPPAPLAKADPPDPGEAVYRAGARVERPLGQSIAETFGAWTQIPAGRLLARDAALRTTLLTGIDQALRPLDVAAGGGADAAVPMIDSTGDGGPTTLSVSMNTGSSRVVEFSRAYRVKLAGQIADDAMATVEAVLRDGTLNGQATEVTARLLRQTIGLTPTQAGHVVSFRRGLSALDPNVLNRALRDARFDRTVARAIDTDTPLTDDQINRMVDAYQRRYLAFRANTIARTEGLRAANNGHIEAAKAFLSENPTFVAIKTWMATHDERTRPDHVALNGQQVIGLYTPFRTVQGDFIMWPHDGNAPLRQIVRCRCAVGITLVPRTVAAQAGFTSVPTY